ncbi:MAG: hypothetical protein Q4F41_20885 [Eubacteriales bacterium]|nr:hypothetical protein [Eubacteriales bacterium]
MKDFIYSLCMRDEEEAAIGSGSGVCTFESLADIIEDAIVGNLD